MEGQVQPLTTVAVNGLDIFVISVILFIIFLVGVYASFEANEFPLGKYLSNLKSRCMSRNNRPPSESPPVMVCEGLATPRRISSGSYSSKVPHGQLNATEFFLANKSMPFFLVGSSLFASNVGSEHFIGQSGDGARRGLAVAMFELYAAILILLLGWVFTPIYRRAGVYTTPEFLELRFNTACRLYLSVITCILYVLTKISASIYGGAVVLSLTLGWDLYWSAGGCIILSSIYTISGGLRAVMYTDFVQTLVFVIGGLFVLYYSLAEVGGWDGIQDRLAEQGKDDFWHLFKPVSDNDYPWTGMFFGQPIGSIWYWCMDQDLVQKVLSAKDITHSKAGCVLAAFIKILPLFVIIIPGVIAGVLFDFSDPNSSLNEDDAYPLLISNIMPHGVIGLLIACIITAMMSSLDSVFNAASSIVTYDLYRKWHPHATEQRLVWIGRVVTVVFAVLSFLWIPIISGDNKGFYRQLVEIQGYLAPPIGIVLILGVTCPRVNGPGAIAGLILGGVLGIIRLIVSIFCAVEEIPVWPWVVHQFMYMNFQHFSFLLWSVTAATCFGVSLVTPAQNIQKIDRFMIQWKDIFTLSADERQYSKWINHFVGVMALVIIIVTVFIWIHFA